MEPLDPLSQLTMCCFGRRSRTAGAFKTAALRNQYYYSPSMAHMNSGGTWPMTSSGIPPTTIFTGAPHPQAFPAQPYILLTQPVIVNAGGALETVPQYAQSATMALIQQQSIGAQHGQHVQAIQYVSDPSPIHKVPSMMTSQYAIYSAAESARDSFAPKQISSSPLIYATPTRQVGSHMTRNMSINLNQRLPSQRNQLILNEQRHQRLNSEIFKRLEIIEKQVDLSGDMDLVERHGIVITRPIEPITLAPHLTDDMLLRYQAHFLHDDEHVIKFIEIIKRPGQTLGLYIRAVQFENPRTGSVREGIVITKIESDSPVYTSKVLHIGNEILSINLIDLQGMLLDDVVTLMSVPKRLVLALRVPKAADNRSLGCEVREQHQKQAPWSANMDVRSQFAGTPTHTRQLTNDQCTAFGEHNRAVGQSISQTNMASSVQQERQRSSNKHQEQLETVTQSRLVRPARVQSAIHRILDEEGSDNFEFATDAKTANSMIGRPTFSQTTGVDAQLQSTSSGAVARMQSPFEQPTSPGVSQLEGQINVQQSIENSHSDSLDKFRSYSMDPEIAKLEREALNKEKQPGAQLPDLDELDEHRAKPRYSSPMARMASQGDQTTNTLPRRTLPTRPEPSYPAVVASSPGSSIKSTVISNIHLGDTPEQSNYFTSSIEAINRELKELRRQRLSMTVCNGANEPIRERNATLNYDL